MKNDNGCDIFCKIAEGVEMDDTFLLLEEEYEELTDEDRDFILNKHFHSTSSEDQPYFEIRREGDIISDSLRKILEKMIQEELDEQWENIDCLTS